MLPVSHWSFGLKSKPFGDQWSKETNLVDLELSCVYLAKLELHFPDSLLWVNRGFPLLLHWMWEEASVVFCFDADAGSKALLLLLTGCHLSHLLFVTLWLPQLPQTPPFCLSDFRARWRMWCCWRLWGRERPTYFCPLGFQLLFIVFYYRRNICLLWKI